VSALAQVLERGGLATVGISLVRGQAVDGRAPRMLHCQFPLGRPLGRPGDRAFQHRVLAAAFDLLPRTDAPVLVDFPDVIDDESDDPLSCALPPRSSDLHPAADEATGLRAAYERTRARTGRTNVTRVDGGADRIPDLLGLLARIAGGETVDDVGLGPRDISAAALDIRAYYEEAALSLVEHVPAARQAESWLYRTTAAGQILVAARDALRDADIHRAAWFPMVPVGQPHA
jgi:hypothetical protein